MKVSVIMASWINPQRPNSDKKLIRAVNSFINQTYTDEKELIIVGDGCPKTKELYDANWKENKQIIYFGSNKLPMYAGGIRDIGLKIASGDLIMYLDNDDVYGKTHIQTIVEQFTDEIDWCYFNDYLVLNKEFNKFQKRFVDTRYGSIGTSSIAHRNPKKSEILKDIKWYSGYSHDFLFVFDLVSTGAKSKKLKTAPQYLVAHYANADF